MLPPCESARSHAARVARWCHAGHCADTTDTLPRLIAAQRSAIAARIADLQALDSRLAQLERHLARPGGALPVLSGPCCDAAAAVVGIVEDTCRCCAVGADHPADGTVAAPGSRPG